MMFAIAIAGFGLICYMFGSGEVVTLSEIVKPSDFNFRLAEYD